MDTVGEPYPGDPAERRIYGWIRFGGYGSCQAKTQENRRMEYGRYGWIRLGYGTVGDRYVRYGGSLRTPYTVSPSASPPAWIAKRLG
jgi:hypothetical protein